MKSKSKKKKNIKINSDLSVSVDDGFSFGEVQQFRNVKFWVYRRKRNSDSPLGKTFHVKLKHPDHREMRRSLKTEDYSDALEKSKEIIIEILLKLKSGESIQSRKFKLVADNFINELKNDKDVRESKIKKFNGVIKNYLNPFFGNMPMDSINEKTFVKYKKWRKEYWRTLKNEEYTYERNGKKIRSNRTYLKEKPVSLNTLQKEDVILRQIIEYGRLSGDISSTKVIKVKSESFKANRKPSLTEKEWKQVLKVSRYRSTEDRLWENNVGKSLKQKKDCINEKTLHQRQLLHDFLNFMVGSGLRTTEGMNIKWSDILDNEITTEVNGKFQKVKSCKLYVRGKSKQRKCDPQPYVKDVLDRVKQRQKQFSKLNRFKFTGKNEYVWCDSFGKRITKFDKSFTKLLEACDLLYDQHGEKRVIGSLRHTYGTLRKNLGEVDTYELAIQMGTSPDMILKHYVHSDDYDRSTSVTRIKKSIKIKEK